MTPQNFMQLLFILSYTLQNNQSKYRYASKTLDTDTPDTSESFVSCVTSPTSGKHCNTTEHQNHSYTKTAPKWKQPRPQFPEYAGIILGL